MKSRDEPLVKFASIAAGVIAVMPFGAWAQEIANDLPSTTVEMSSKSIKRSITLREAGFGTGLIFRQLSGQATVFIPVPDATPLLNGIITLKISHGATVPVDRYLQVSVAGRPALTEGLGDRQETFSLEVPFDAAAVSSGFLAIGLTYSGAFSDRVCVDERASGDFIQIAPESTVTLALDPERIKTPAQFSVFRPERMRVVLPDQPSLGLLAATTRASALFGAEAGNLRVRLTRDEHGAELDGRHRADRCWYLWGTKRDASQKRRGFP